MHILILGGAGFVGLNIASASLSAGHRVTLFDRTPPPPDYTHPAAFMQGDVRDRERIAAAIVEGIDVVVLGAAVTAGPGREAADPETILSVNLGALPSVLEACRRKAVRRVINLSSAAAYGAAAASEPLLHEGTCASPESLYAVTKFASERVGQRLAGHWGLDFVSVRLSAVFGRWERDTGVRDTLSPHAQILAAARSGRPAILPRPGARDWIYATDVGEAVCALAGAQAALAPVYNITSGQRWSALAWGQAFARHNPGLICRLAEPGEAPTIDLHGSIDRPSLSGDLAQRDLGWSARFDMESSAQDLAAWWQAPPGGGA